MKQKFVGFIIWSLYRLLRLTWKVQLIEPATLIQDRKEKKPYILSHWHGDEMTLAWAAGYYNVVTIVSNSKDGNIMDTFFKLNGGKTTRGSSSQGGAQALKNLVSASKKMSLSVSFAVDGPKGPIYQIKPGIFQFYRLQPNIKYIYAAGIVADRFWCFEKAWNKAILPKPFARLIIHWQEFELDTQRIWDPRDPTLAQNLMDAMHQSKAVAQKILSLK